MFGCYIIHFRSLRKHDGPGPQNYGKNMQELQLSHDPNSPLGSDVILSISISTGADKGKGARPSATVGKGAREAREGQAYGQRAAKWRRTPSGGHVSQGHGRAQTSGRLPSVAGTRRFRRRTPKHKAQRRAPPILTAIKPAPHQLLYQQKSRKNEALARP